MKTNVYYSLLSMFISIYTFSQLGINKVGSDVTLDIAAKTINGTNPEGLIVPRLTGDQIQGADSQYTLSHRGTVIYALSAVTLPSVKTANMNKEGLYFFDGNIWQKLNDGQGSNIYTVDGTLTGSRTVDIGNRVLSFSSAPSSGNSHFQVAGNTFNVNTRLGFVGMGMNNPVTRLQVINSLNNTVDGLAGGINNCGTPCGQSTPSNLRLYNINGSNTSFVLFDFSATNSPLATSPGVAIRGIDRSGNNAGLQFFSKNSAGYISGLAIRSLGVIGINSGGSAIAALDVNGSITNTATYNAGTATTIDFFNSNLATTSANPGAFTLTNIKDGGAYTLAVQGTVSGISTFAASGFTVRYVNNIPTIPGTHTLYKLLVMGTEIYVMTIAGF
ncbi:hypothetical protein [Chryseobacterium aurantiacum]|uniref:hypothetical protein n=1 Tax=Chryseobacterium aurantiacum TaxID=2116499 RepID=UPI000D135450|nr:hypothetical protein [Chryseobacterium aurantiacum]